jgi:class 3 adenylate cyclase
MGCSPRVIAQAAQPAQSAESFIGVVLVLIFPLFLAAIAGGIVLIVRRRRSKRSGEPTCAHCGYNVTGLTTFTCPECGSDLRQVGIRGAAPTATNKPRPLGALILKLCVLAVVVLLIGAAASSFVFYQFWPFPIHSQYKLDIFTGGNRPYQRVLIDYTASGISYHGASDFNARSTLPVNLDQWPSRKATIRFSFARLQPLDLVADFRADRMTWEYEKPDGTKVNNSGAIVPATILAALKAAEIDSSKLHVDDDAQALASALVEMGSIAPDTITSLSPQFPQKCLSGQPGIEWGYGASGGTSADAMPGRAQLSLGGCLLLWLLGAVPMFVRYRRRMRLLASQPRDEKMALREQRPPEAATTARTLTVMFSDIQNYTASTASSHRMAPLDLVRRHRDTVTPIARRRGGRIVKSLGDGLLLTFDSATDAVCAGVEIQSAIAAMSRGFDDSPKLAIRIGIATGEAILSDGDIFGEVVNVAARLQQAAGSGEVVFSESTCAIINREEVRFDELGERELKGVGSPVKVFRAVPPGTSG